jgi:type III secretion system YscQ/HrcQ family protein
MSTARLLRPPQGDDARPVPLNLARALPKVDLRAAHALRRLLARMPWQPAGPLAGVRLEWQPAPRTATGLLLTCAAAGMRFEVCAIEAATWGLRAEALQPVLPAPLRTAFVAQTTAAAFNALSAELGCRVELVDAQPFDAPVPADAIGFVLHRGPRAPSRGWLRALDDEALRGLLKSAEVLLARRTHADWRLTCRPVLGRVRLQASDLRGLEPEDVLVVRRAPAASTALECSLTVGDNRRVFGRARVEADGLHVLDVDVNEEMVMDDMPLGDGARGLAPAAIELSVRIELAPWRASLAELDGLAPGAVIDTGEDLRQASVSLWVDRRCIGNGRLVAIGDALGVRIEELALSRDGAPRGAAVDAAAGEPS